MPVNYGSHVVTVIRSSVFDRWLRALRDPQARARINARILRLTFGNLGDAKAVGEGVLEMRIDHGPGYRVYFVPRGAVVVLLLCGGDKSTQRKDIERAKTLAREFEG
jgi:putative addiction module killer protein